MKMLRALLVAALAFALPAPPAVAQQQGEMYCSQQAQYDASTNGATRIFTANATNARQVFICGYILNVGATATNVQLRYGTGTTCGTGTVNLTPLWVLPIAGQIFDEQGVYHGMLVPAGNDLCIFTSAGNAVQAQVFYTYQ